MLRTLRMNHEDIVNSLFETNDYDHNNFMPESTSKFNIDQYNKNQSFHKKDISYGWINYLKYEYPNRADNAKKILEKNSVSSFINAIKVHNNAKPVSLDIGCATCRYPLWLSNMGFHAVGYDINDTALEICQQVAKNNPNIEIKKKNILESDFVVDQFSLVTCMMGTFNHISRNGHNRFVEWIYKSLKKDGSFIFSTWNIKGIFTNYLYFYSSEEKEYIKENTLSLNELSNLLEKHGFKINNIEPICFFPDQCYEEWVLSESKIIEIDVIAKSLLDRKNSQMSVIHVVKQ